MTSENFPIEEIPMEAKLFYRINKVDLNLTESDDKFRIKPVAFDPRPRGESTQMSTDWEKYSSAVMLRARSKKPHENGIVSFLASQIRQLKDIKNIFLEVSHDPINYPPNQAHSIVHDVPLPASGREHALEVRMTLRDLCAWEIKYEEPVL